MKTYRKGVFFVVYKKEKGKLLYLMLHRKKHWKGWEFPKAGLKKWEKSKANEEKGVRRELKEEAGGCKLIRLIRFNIRGKYKYNKQIPERKDWLGQTYSLYAAEVGCKKVKIDKEEHDNYKWLRFKEALKILTWPNQKKCLRVVNKKINASKNLAVYFGL